ncbi:unnamed protein product [Symbiodinium microadriaticum]|nr:unnamed protein product [Symbiodinium microadriaticum]
MAIKPEFEYEDEWEAFLEKTDPRKRLEKRFQNYTWSFGVDEDDDGFTRDCVQLEVPTVRETEPRHVQAKLTSRHLKLTVHGEDVINDDFSDERWLSVEDTNKVGGERAFVARPSSTITTPNPLPRCSPQQTYAPSSQPTSLNLKLNPAPPKPETLSPQSPKP